MLSLNYENINYLDEELRFMYKNNQGHLTVFCIVFVWLRGPPSPVRIMNQVPWFMYQNRLGPSGGIYNLNFVPCFVVLYLNVMTQILKLSCVSFSYVNISYVLALISHQEGLKTNIYLFSACWVMTVWLFSACGWCHSPASWKQTNISFEAFLVGNQGWCIKGQMLR